MVRGKKLSEEKERALREAYKSAHEESPIDTKKILRELGGEESTITDEIREFLRVDFTKESSFKFFRKLFQILNKMEEKELYDFIRNEIENKWKKEKLINKIKELEESKEKFRDLKLNILKSRKHITLKKEDYWNTLPLIRYTEVSNKSFRKLGISLDAFYMKTIRCLIEEIDGVFLSLIAKEQE